MNRLLRVLIAADDPTTRECIREALARAGIEALVLPSAHAAIRVADSSDIIVLETVSDAAAFTQVVYELYKKLPSRGALPIIGLVPPRVVEQNPAIAVWNIDGHAALSATVSLRRGFEEAVVLFVNRMLGTRRE